MCDFSTSQDEKKYSEFRFDQISELEVLKVTQMIYLGHQLTLQNNAKMSTNKVKKIL